VLEAMVKAFPAAPVYTAVHDPRETPEELQKLQVRTSFLQTAAVSYRSFKFLLPLLPSAFKRLKLPEGSTLISSASGFAKCVRNPGLHVCYCYTPPRFLWDVGLSSASTSFADTAARLLFGSYLRREDRKSVEHIDRFIGISKAVAARVQRIYGRQADVIEPPTRVDRFQMPRMPQDYFLVISRLLRYKRIDVALEAFNSMRLPLVVVGDGPARAELRRIAGPTITFEGRTSDDRIPDLLSKARAVIVPGEEDWGMVAIEAAAAGCPVIAAGVGGNLETVVPAVTGLHYGTPYGPTELIAAVRRFDGLAFDTNAMRRHAARFDESQFIKRLRECVTDAMNQQPN
jgi:glycosyltransferase involved in cell wall biosynthesis